ncbi:tyrosine-type recombinase/integrase [Chitinophaga oryziterrae]|uniref:Tyrosine-type recombinase/integrase n=1 Tax=Chitinophaga oryziterrae TaxID=1031224 RepID=A0A6N8JF45_9BACT|nr:tyrosine-type recombinase/integrase [Chitinophaga oryziterrae]MVT43840.1 tyrosine-type recombinase/integrase [Chitinophaga oryziterrae]
METVYLLHSNEHVLLCAGFKVWLQTLGYAESSVYNLPRHTGEFLYYQEQHGKTTLSQLQASDVIAFITQMKEKIGIRTGRGYSAGHINKYIQALLLFSRYIRETGKCGIGFSVERVADIRGKPAWLTVQEIQQLYAATDDSVLGMRDRAMLAVFYGCGLRLNEGASLETGDLLTDRGLLYVRNGKGYRERYVPISRLSQDLLQLYITDGRPQLLQTSTQRLFIGANKGEGLTKQSLYVRIKQLAKKAEILKNIGTHTLRHSIATHLLQSGMVLEQIQAFLGHAGLDSTQIYTHLTNEV